MGRAGSQDSWLQGPGDPETRAASVRERTPRVARSRACRPRASVSLLMTRAPAWNSPGAGGGLLEGRVKVTQGWRSPTGECGHVLTWLAEVPRVSR